MKPPDMTRIPSAALIASIESEIEAAAREEIEAWRAAVSEEILKSAALRKIIEGCKRWAEEQIHSGKSGIDQAGTSAIGGIALSAFLLGFLASERIDDPQPPAAETGDKSPESFVFINKLGRD